MNNFMMYQKLKPEYIGFIFPLTVLFILKPRDLLWFPQFHYVTAVAVYLLCKRTMDGQDAKICALMLPIPVLLIDYALNIIKHYDYYRTYPQLFLPIEIVLIEILILISLILAYALAERWRIQIVTLYIILSYIFSAMIPSEGKFGFLFIAPIYVFIVWIYISALEKLSNVKAIATMFVLVIVSLSILLHYQNFAQSLFTISTLVPTFVMMDLSKVGLVLLFLALIYLPIDIYMHAVIAIILSTAIGFTLRKLSWSNFAELSALMLLCGLNFPPFAPLGIGIPLWVLSWLIVFILARKQI